MQIKGGGKRVGHKLVDLTSIFFIWVSIPYLTLSSSLPLKLESFSAVHLYNIYNTFVNIFLSNERLQGIIMNVLEYFRMKWM